MTLRLKAYIYLSNKNNKNKREKGTKKCVIK